MPAIKSIEHFPFSNDGNIALSEVVGYLYELENRGYKIERERWPGVKYCFLIRENNRILRTLIQDQNDLWRLATGPKGRLYVEFFRSINDLRDRLGFEPSVRPESVRTTQNLPQTNISAIAALIKGKIVSCIFDPYLDDKGLSNLASLVNISEGSWSQQVKFLTGLNSNSTKLRINYFTQFFHERNLKGELRSTTEKHHRRFLLLEGGQTLVVGFSWNQPGYAETARLESHPEDLVLFNEEWNKAITLLKI